MSDIGGLVEMPVMGNRRQNTFQEKLTGWPAIVP
jgi:hypothetical protein